MNSQKAAFPRSNADEPVVRTRRNRVLLSSLPLDTLVHVQSFLEPHDILNLRKCCRRLDQVTREKAVWINAVRLIAEQYNVLPTTFPAGTSLCILEHVATSPLRFISRLERELRAGCKSLSPFARRTINRRMPQSTGTAVHDPRIFKFLRLVPGGRFLVTATLSCVVELWDLGITSSTALPREPIASITVPDLMLAHSRNTQILIDWDECGTSLYLLTQSAHYTSAEADFTVFVIQPFAVAPSFRKVKTLAVERGGELTVHFTNKLLVVGSNWWVEFLRFRDDMSARMVVDFRVDMVLVVGQNVIIFDPSPAISVFQIPQFSPVIEEVSVVTEISKPLLIVPVKEHSHVTTTRRPNRLPHADARAYVDIIGEYGWDVTVHRFVVTPIQGTSWANAPTCLPIFLDASTFDYLEFSYDVLAKPLSADQTLLLWDNLGRLYAGTSSITPRWQNGRPLHPSISLWAYDCNDESDSACFDFCEFLGRLCVITKDHEVLVMDFIACPPSL